MDEETNKKLLKPNSDPVNVLIVRPFSRLVSTRLFLTSVTPNQVTVAALFSALIAAGLIVWMDSLVGAILAAFFIQLYIVLDCADGELARLKSLKSNFGKWLDGIVDTVGTIVLLAAFAFRAFGEWGMVAVVIGFVSVLGFAVANFGFQYGQLVFGEKLFAFQDRAGEGEEKTLARSVISLFSIAKSFSPGVQVLILTLGALLSIHFYALIVYGAWSNLVWLGRCVKYHRMRDKLG
ncbi:hypothetical protein AUJ65_02145 [Candidatus Micrarchaeota archaeon CG1_02_51_15]|nr:MAG: hypothetical protein AUJ65_02145 [Candidatus Micrarchaeota archaeon CG1_02_51_15]